MYGGPRAPPCHRQTSKLPSGSLEPLTCCPEQRRARCLPTKRETRGHRWVQQRVAFSLELPCFFLGRSVLPPRRNRIGLLMRSFTKRTALGIYQRSQFLVTRGRPKRAQRFGLNLPDPFPRHCKTLPDLLESVSVAVLQSEPHLDDLFLAKAQSLQDRCRALL